MKPFILFLCLATSLFAADKDSIYASIQSCGIREVLPTGSMRPTFDENYIVLVQKRDWRSLRAGDIIVFHGTGYWEGRDICHRIIAISSGGSVVATKGDANPDSDQRLIGERDYVGLVVGILRKDI